MKLSSAIWPWVVPLLAAGVAGAMMARDALEAGPIVRLRMKENPGLEAGRSAIRHRGARCGTITALRLSEDMSEVEAEAELEESCAGLAAPGSTYWVVKPEIGWGKIRGLQTLRTGPFISALPGSDPPPEGAAEASKEAFDVLEAPPARARGRSGQTYFVVADEARHIRSQSPIYHRGVEVGHVESIELAANGHDVVFELFLERRYIPLIREKTIFWPVTGFNADIGLFGADIQAGTLESFFSGGIAFATPEESPPVSESTQFRLADEAPDSDWIEWEPKIGIGPPRN